jgi:hypothetical protein
MVTLPIASRTGGSRSGSNYAYAICAIRLGRRGS